MFVLCVLIQSTTNQVTSFTIEDFTSAEAALEAGSKIKEAMSNGNTVTVTCVEKK